jgi:NMD protein affecting ribosome stability and mRNA decay
MKRYRWPVAECLHEDHDVTEVKNGVNKVLRTTVRCPDCGATKTPTGWQ